MTHVIRVDDEIYDWLQRQAKPFEDTPNSVLRRVARLDERRPERASEDEESRVERTTGKKLNKRWQVNARHALYRETGDWYHHLTSFPGALFDATGYVRFETEQEYTFCPGLQIGDEVHVAGGIRKLPNYLKIV